MKAERIDATSASMSRATTTMKIDAHKTKTARRVIPTSFRTQPDKLAYSMTLELAICLSQGSQK